MSATPTDLALALSAYADDGCQGNAGGHGQLLVSVPMGMRFALRIAWRVLVLAVLVVVMEMFVFQRLMDVQVFVSLGDVQPDAD